MSYKALLLFGAPGSGKGTQGKILGKIPGFFHCACGDVFRSLDLHTDYGQAFLQYSSKGQLVPDDITIGVWEHYLQAKEKQGRFKPESDFLVLDGIPRNLSQAKLLASRLDIRRIFHLDCPDQNKLVERLRKRALKENRLDDINEDVIASRLKVYQEETMPVLDFYGPKLISTIDSTQLPHQVLRDILKDIEVTE